jgi:hypothetical protein
LNEILNSSFFIHCAFGLGAIIFGPQILKSPPDHTTLSFFTVLAVMVPAMILGGIGAIFTICLPLHIKFQVPLAKSDKATRKILHFYAAKILHFTKEP